MDNPKISSLNADERDRKIKKITALLSFLICIFFNIILILFAVNTGSLKVSLMELYDGLFIAYNPNVATIYDLRFPRIIISLLAGAGIATSGCLFQAVLKNPLADPGIIGISSGAGFVSVIITAFFPLLFFLTPIFAFIGGILAFFLVYTLSWKDGLSPLRIILVGVAVNAMFAGLSSALNSMAGGNMQGVASIVNGNITMKTWSDVSILFPYIIIGIILSLFMAVNCNLLSLEDTTAKALGVNVNRTRIVISSIAVLLASISTAVVGIIGFLGLIVPHIGRLLVGADYRKLIPFSVILGSFTFLLADTLGRTIASPYEVPAAIIMSIIGGPFFIALLRGSRNYGK
ncbi:MAG: FecCD family ABC transporter permease [Peptoanaerobacter stomatis]|uniref:FecCD family ABC transporter permease n=1 Tax=Clostridia TaxID=186801 RepID=UPI003FA0979B